MLLEIFMNVTEALVHLFLLNSLIPAKNKKYRGAKSFFFITYVTAMYCIMTYLDLNFQVGINVVIALEFFIYISIRNNEVRLIKRIAVSLLSLYIIDLSVSVSFFLVPYMLDILSIQGTEIWENFSLLCVVLLSRLFYLLIAKVVLVINKNRPRKLFLERKYIASVCVILLMYLLSAEIFYAIVGEAENFSYTSAKLLLVIGIILGVTLIIVYAIIKNQYSDAMRALEIQKTAYDNRSLIEFTADVNKYKQLKSEIIDLMTPAVQLVNDFEYEEVRQMIQDIICELDESVYNTDYHLDDQVEAAIALKTEECKEKNIYVNKLIKTEYMKPAIFTNIELVSIITNIFDISMSECDSNGCDENSLFFTFDMREAGVLIQMEYKYIENNQVNDNPMISFLPEKLLKISLNKFGGYMINKKNDGRMKRKVFLPYVGKAYYLRGSSSRSVGADR